MSGRDLHEMQGHHTVHLQIVEYPHNVVLTLKHEYAPEVTFVVVVLLAQRSSVCPFRCCQLAVLRLFENFPWCEYFRGYALTVRGGCIDM